MYLSTRDLDQLRRDFPSLCIHDNFGARRCSVHTAFDGCPEKAGYVLQTADGEPTDSLVCERCRPMVEHLIATRPRFRGYSLVAFAYRPDPD